MAQGQFYDGKFFAVNSKKRRKSENCRKSPMLREDCGTHFKPLLDSSSLVAEHLTHDLKLEGLNPDAYA